MRKYVIYQDFTEAITPISTPSVPEEITIDKWLQPRDNPVLRKTLKTAILAGSFFFFNTVSLEAGAKVPDWHPQQNQPYIKIKMRQTAGVMRVELIPRGRNQAIFM